MSSVVLSVVPKLGSTVGWQVRVDGVPVKWDWTDGQPAVEHLGPVRRVRSSASSRHVPVRALCSTTNTALLVESGLEYELLTWLDHRRDITWVAAQPVELSWSDKVRHTPDLLSVDVRGAVTLWDARSKERQDDDFWLKARRTAKECERVGWGYEVFEGLSEIAGLNLRWLAGARRAPQWLDAVRPQLLEQLADGPRTLGELMALDDGRGFQTSCLWHLIWTQELVVDLDHLWDQDTVCRRGQAVGA
ncbi:TnsA-like heteromeric transposase endonuclease subunit [Arsenicicoccus bolidensis]|uniref:TnsA-like heteromeric transposase endonuclease subunit n=1 Tax=Arsenicicoccus bolidensis TaxID=229480 RepID=A0ABS9Q710_9MICO|nr:TnsA-like heteromeric transposase endonuclease subunit [Arsenicicoccus bolidensis]MCG7323659.1 TnsA-like heteromeric transposase endonuclease subunit [Arsenicicoccus bolidensis]